MISRRSAALVICITVLAASPVAYAHPGGLDANGGHMDHRTGLYHFHGGGGGGGFGFGIGGFDSGFMTPTVRVRRRTKARVQPPTEPRTAARTSARATPFLMPTIEFDADFELMESDAAGVLDIGKLLVKQGKRKGAGDYLADMALRMGGTRAAREATGILATLMKTPVVVDVQFLATVFQQEDVIARGIRGEIVRGPKGRGQGILEFPRSAATVLASCPVRFRVVPDHGPPFQACFLRFYKREDQIVALFKLL